ncbi:MAG: bifunctional hydroxymethylpyrimidine kinase/phosphomethylpyrimidine kinase [Clostridia bacterium]|nr:bifunctional hydroxymethylpyrimidine kinase/phosphomethylpyrimidine kinase [Clostridia bacterium]
MYKILTIAGSDCSGGAGIQADIKTITAHGMYAMSAITSLTAQNTTGVYGVFDSTPEFLANQLDCIFTDIKPDAVKIGMVSDKTLIKTIAEKLKKYKAENIVLDPVMVSTSGSKLLREDAIEVLVNELMPLSILITPNLDEASVLLGRKIKTVDEMRIAAKELGEKYNCGVLVKGGHLDEKATDVLFDKIEFYEFTSERINTGNTHGTGCTLSSAIACNIAEGHSLEESVKNAKEYLTGALKYGLDLGKGSGPVNHCYLIGK